MAKATPARRAALRVLGQVRQRDAYAREVLRASPAVGALEPRDRAFAGRLVLGVTAARGTLDRLLDGHVRKPGSLEPRVRDAMRIASRTRGSREPGLRTCPSSSRSRVPRAAVTPSTRRPAKARSRGSSAPTAGDARRTSRA